MSDMSFLGIRVLRGPDWDQNEVEGGGNHLGTVVKVKAEEGTAEVVWDNGEVTTCRVGKEGKHDLRIYDDVPTGESVSRGVVCQGCRNSSIYGTSWRCSTCSNLHLCSRCYHLGVHPLSHHFLRLDNHKQKGIAVGTRSGASRIPVSGIFPEARVARGRDWEYGDADGGADGSGVVVDVVSPESGSARNAVRVSWDSGQSLQHRLGLHGKVDLVCTEEAPGPACYLSHLPVLDCRSAFEHQQASAKTKSEKCDVGIGDRVKVALDFETFRDIQSQTVSWTDSMAKCFWKTGVVKAITPAGYVDVDFEGEILRLSPVALSKVSQGEKKKEIKEGDRVRIVSDLELLRSQQRDHGGWVDDMAQAAGKVGTVRNVNYKGDVRVHFGQQYWIFNPDSCQPAPDCTEDSIALQGLGGALKGIAGGLHNQTKKTLGDYLTKKKEQPSRDKASSPTTRELVQAIFVGNTKLISRLIDNNPGLVHETILGATALHLAVVQEQIEAVRLLVAKGSKINKGDKDDDTPLILSVASKNTELVKTLLELGADITLSNDSGQTPLHIAVLADSRDIVRLLLHHLAPVNRRDVHGDTPLFDAIQDDDVSEAILDALLAVGDLDLQTTNKKGFYALHLSALHNRPRVAERLLQRDPSQIKVQIGDKRFSPLHIAVVNDHTQVMQVLIKAGSPVDQRTSSGETPLHLACSEDLLSSVRILVESGADINTVNNHHETPLHFCFGPSRSVLKQLLQGSGSGQGEKGLEVAKFLVQRGARTDIRNREGKTALDIAAVAVREKLTRFIRERDAPRPEKPGHVQDSMSNSRPSPGSNTAAAKCVTCHQREADVIFLPCAHKVLCRQCAGKGTTRLCQKCKKTIEGKIDTEGKQVGAAPTADSNESLQDMSAPKSSQKKNNADASVLDEAEIRVGDKVRIGVDAETFRTIQKRRNAWKNQMAKCIGKTGVVKGKTEQGEYVVDFDGEKWRIDPKGLTKGHLPKKPKEGDTVRIESNVRLLEEQQTNHGGWNPNMAQAAGKVGQIITTINSDFVVRFGEQYWTFNPASCKPAPGCPIDSIPLEGIEKLLKADLLKRLENPFLGSTSESAELAELVRAVHAGNCSMAARILQHNSRLAKMDVDGVTALHIAAIEGQTEAVHLLVAKGADINKGDKDGDTPLFRCAHIRNAETARALIELGADINAANKKGQTPLHQAVAADSTDVVRLLLQNLASVNRRAAGGGTPVFLAVAKDTTNPAILDALLATGDLDLRLASDERATPLHMAVNRSKTRDVEKILARDPSLVNAVMDHQLTPLHLAAQADKQEIVKLLLKANAAVNARAARQMTSLHMACAENYLGTARILVENGANVNAVDGDGDTPLHVFCFSALTNPLKGLLGRSSTTGDRNLELPRYLVQHGAHLDLRNRRGLTAMDLAPDFLKEDLINLHKENARKNTNTETSTSATRPNTEPKKCVTCHQRVAAVIFLPCAHKLVCHKCTGSQMACGECGKTVEGHIDTEGNPVQANQSQTSSERAPDSETGQQPECKVQ